jgi:ribosomal protein S17
MSIGFIKLHRKIIEWEWYSDVNVCRVFLHLLLTANFENKKWQGIDISRGQIITSLEKLGKSTTLTIQQVRTALTKLKSTHEITIKATKLHTFITLTNYNLYQDKIVESNTPDNTLDNNSSTKKQQTINKEATTTKEGKEGKESEERKESNPLTEDFQKFWEDYTPVKVSDGKVVSKGSRKTALIAYERARKNHNAEKIYEGAAKYLVNCYENNRLSCQAVVFLNQERFLDDYEQTNLEVKKHD